MNIFQGIQMKEQLEVGDGLKRLLPIFEAVEESDQGLRRAIDEMEQRRENEQPPFGGSLGIDTSFCKPPPR